MKITNEDVAYVAALSKLRFDPSEEAQIAERFEVILNYFEKLNELDVSEVEPLTHILDVTNVTRADETQKCLEIEDVLANAPQSQDRVFVLPKIL
jgi:aspartyl-tRNA(Asn)/glutamyl-tRNA(Gln) amidotransferase subunit C